MNEGILIINKPVGLTSFAVVYRLRKILHVQKIGHGGTLDPFATGVLVMLVGRKYTRLASTFLTDDKEYLATLQLGSATDTYDCTGTRVAFSDVRPTREEIDTAVAHFQGTFEQIPPMFSAKKVQGKRLYELARKGKEVERRPSLVTCQVTVQRYEYPNLYLHITCSKGTYVRSLGSDIGLMLGSYAFVSELTRVRSGRFTLADSISLDQQDKYLFIKN